MSTTDPSYPTVHTAIFLSALTGLLSNSNVAGAQFRVNGNTKQTRATIISEAKKIADEGAAAL